jgi:hypothetical protein
MGREEKRRLRACCRERLWGLDRYFQEEGRFASQLLSLYKLPLDYKIDRLAAYELSQVVSMSLKEFSGNHNHLQFSPSMQECETQLKSLFLSGLKSLEHLKPFSPQSLTTAFDPELSSQLSRSVAGLDALVGEAGLMLVSVGFWLQSFEHLLLDEALLLEDEVRALLEEVPKVHAAQPRAARDGGKAAHEGPGAARTAQRCTVFWALPH